MRTFGLIGYPLSHSFSRQYFTEKFEKENIRDCEFRNFEIKNVNQFLPLTKSTPALAGLSVTIPHKKSIMNFLDEIDGVAKETGAVNCVKIGNKLQGYNTDVIGFENSLRPQLNSQHTNALILGSGGASKAAAYVLRKLNITFNIISRTVPPAYSDLNKEVISSHCLIINTTPAGLFPDVNSFPDIPYEFLTSNHLLYDLIYNPEETLFLKKGKAKGAQIKNGFEMLQLQAEAAWKIWNE